MTYHGSFLDVPHAGLLTVLMALWALWFALGWCRGAQRGAGVAVLAGAFIVAASFSIFHVLIVVLWAAFFVAGVLARGFYDRHFRGRATGTLHATSGPAPFTVTSCSCAPDVCLMPGCCPRPKPPPR